MPCISVPSAQLKSTVLDFGRKLIDLLGEVRVAYSCPRANRIARCHSSYRSQKKMGVNLVLLKSPGSTIMSIELHDFF